MLLDTNQVRAHLARSRSRTGANGKISSVAIVTMTLARSPGDAASLHKSLRALTGCGLPIYVGEGGSAPGFVERIGQLPNVHLCTPDPKSKPGLVTQLRSAFEKVQLAHPDYVLYTEPDKIDFFRRGLPALLRAAAATNETPAGLIVASRSPRAFRTFPEGQRTAEALMNRISGEALGKPGDYTYGPMLLGRQLLRWTALIPDNLGWGWRFFMLAVARQLRIRVELCPVGSACPPAQRGEDDAAARSYRLRQLEQNVTGLANGWTCLLDQPAELPNVLVQAA